MVGDKAGIRILIGTLKNLRLFSIVAAECQKPAEYKFNPVPREAASLYKAPCNAPPG
jgi:hypothetical protein